MLKCIIVNNMHMDSNPTAPMAREAGRGAVIPTAGGERGLGQGEGVRGSNPTAFIIIRFEHGRLGQSSLPVCRLEAKSSDAKEDWARGGCAWASFGPPLPLDLCQILSKSRDCALRARAFTSLNQSGFEHGRLGQSSLPNLR